MTLPTYMIGAPLTTPIFYHGRAYQGAQGHCYPYPAQDKLTYVRKNVAYKMLYLENKYVKIGVLPEIGGRIFYALDKTNNYTFLYSASVVKPGLVGMLGAWLDGGIEWNVPHHHRPSVYMPVSYKLEEGPGGSKTIWIGELEINHRMRWSIGLTLHPDTSYLEGTFRLVNQSPVANTFLYFANFGVPASPDYRVLFPPSTEVGTYHAKTDFVRWPVADGRFQGIDFSGEDISLWKTHILMNSIFAHDCTEDWFGGYDHGKQGGVLYVADHHISPGKKFWTWGAGEEGQMWDKLLTEPQDGPVMELMAGSYSDNEPDYSWIQPYEVKTVKQYWYPFQRIGVVKKANLDAAVSLDVNAQHAARIGVAATAERSNCRILLEAGGKPLFETTSAIGPGTPFLKEIALPAGIEEKELRVAVSQNGHELISYVPYQRKNLPLPKPATPPPPPSEKNNEETLLAGLRLGQFFNPAAEPYPWYEEVLKRDPNDARANTELGILYWKRGMFAEAEQKLRAAVARVTHNYTRPKDGEALYYLGLALKAQSKFEEAYNVLFDATWSYAWHSPAFEALAEIACARDDYRMALDFLERALSTNTSNVKALDLKAAILLRLDRKADAERAASAALAVDRLDVWAQREQAAATGRGATVVLWPGSEHNDVQPYLETAVNLANAGLRDEAISVLRDVVNAYRDQSRVYPMVYYWLGYLNERADKPGDASRAYGLASQVSPDYCFPFRTESIAVLRRAMDRDPKDARAPYYLGNLLYERQPAEAIRMWEVARSRDPRFAMVQRNLADAYAWTEHDHSKAIPSLETAVSLDPQPKFLAELDQLYERAGVSPQRRLEMLEKHQQAVMERDDALIREIRLYVQLGNYDKALALLMNGHHYTVWEGGSSAHSPYQDALILKAHELLKAKQYPEAMDRYKAALEYPDNFSEGRPIDGGRAPIIYYFMGLVYEAMGESAMAREHFEKAAAVPSPKYRPSEAAVVYGPDILFHRGRAAQKLGRTSEAQALFDRLIESGRQALASADDSRPDYFAKFGERDTREMRLAQGHYVLGLGYVGAGKPREARTEFEQAIKLNVNHLAAQVQLANLGDPFN